MRALASRIRSDREKANRRKDASRSYWTRRLSGLCPKCGGQPAADDTYCATCREKGRLLQQELRAKRKQQGLCRDCSQPAEPGRLMCLVCQQEMNEAQANWQRKDREEKQEQRRLSRLDDDAQLIRELAQMREYRKHQEFGSTHRTCLADADEAWRGGQRRIGPEGRPGR